MDNRTERLAPGVWRVEVGAFTNVFVLADDAGRLTVVDTGTASAGPRLVRSVRMLGFDPRTIDDVLLTHWHADHSGSAAALATSSAAPRVWIGEGDLAVLTSGRRPPVPPAPDANAGGRLVLARAPAPAPVPGARPLLDGDRRATAGGLEVVATPGHTPGHVAFLLPAHGILLAGDALWNLGRLSPGPRYPSSALSARPATLRRLATLDVATLAVAHGPPVTHGTRERLERIAARG